MNFVADESVDQPIVERLRIDGHKILAVMEASPGLADDDVLRMANTNTMLLLTADKDFGEIVFRRRLIALGVVLIRLAGLSAESKAEIVSTAIANHQSALWQCFTVIEPNNVRIRSQFASASIRA